MASTSGIAFSGLSSGLDTAKVIDSLLRFDQSRIDALKLQKKSIETKISSFGTLKSKVSTLLSKLDALRFQSQIMQRTTSTDSPSGQSAIVTASADNTANLGSFKVTVDRLATVTQRLGAVGVGDESVDTTAALNASGLGLTPTAGRFTINGVAIDVSNPTSLDDFVNAINAVQGQTGVTASFVNGPSGGPERLQIVNDGAHTGQSISLGSAGDTSNFLTALKLSTATQTGDTIESTASLGRLNTGVALGSARLATALSQPTGSFTINGVSFTYDASTDTISSKLAEINASTANVTASHDAVSNRITLTAKATGAQSIALSDTSGNFLAGLGATNAAGGTETLGDNALFRIDTVAGNAQQSSTSNTVTGVIQGVTLDLKQQSATPVTVTIGQDADKPLAALKDFVTAFNDLVDHVRKSSRPDENKRPGSLQDALGARLLADSVRTMATDRVTGLSTPYSSLADIGVTTGAVGSAVGTTNTLTIDEAKFSKALSTNPLAVHDLLNNAVAGSEGVFTKLRSYLVSSTLPAGLLTAMSDTASAQQTNFTDRIAKAESTLDVKRQRLEAQFSRMEAALAAFQSQGQRLQSQLGQLGAQSSGR